MNKLEVPYFAGQIALALCVARIDLPAIALPLRYNFPNDEIAAARYPEEMRNAVVIHYLRTNEIERQDIFQRAECYLDFLSKAMNTPNEAFRAAVLKIFGKTYPFPKKEENAPRTIFFGLPIRLSGRLLRMRSQLLPDSDK